MPVVVRDHPRRRFPLLRTARRLRAVVGGVMVAVSSATGMLVVVIPALVLVGLGGGGSDGQTGGGLSGEDREILGLFGRAWVLAALITLCGQVAGRRLLRGNRRTVLWLRRFRDPDGIRVVVDALDHIGRSWRVVTLDDMRAPSVGVATGLRVTSGALRGLRRTVPRLLDVAGAIGPPLTKGCVAGIAAIMAWGIVTGRFFEFLDGFGRSWDDLSGPAEVLALRALVAILLAEFALLLAFVAVSLALVPILGLFTLIGQVTDDVATAEQTKTAEINGPDDVERVAASVAQGGSKLMAPRLTVLRVDGSVWQQTVETLDRQCSAVLVDVSEVSDNLLWELRQLSGRTSGVVYVGERSAVATLPPALAEALDGREVLAYDTGWWGRIRFQQNLFADLEAAVVRYRLHARSARSVVWMVLGSAGLVYGLVEATEFVRMLLEL